MKRIVSIIVLMAALALTTGQALASLGKPGAPVPDTEGPDIRAKVEPKGQEGPGVR